MPHPIRHPAPLLLPLLAGLALAGCSTVAVPPPHAIPTAPVAFAHQGLVVAAPQAPGPWWHIFANPQLDALEDRAMAHSTSLQAAAARLARARAMTGQADADRFPQVGIGASSQRLGGDFNGAQGVAGTLHQLRLEASYEVDFVGRLSRASQAARLDELAAASMLDSARLLVQADVAQAYFTLRAIDAERSLVRQTVGAYRDTLALTEKRFAAGDVSELDVARARMEVAANESQALALDRRRAELESAVAVLVGDVPGQLSIAEAGWGDSVPTVPAGLPSAMLERRPDVAAARASFESTQVRVRIAQSAWFPDVSLTAAAGGASPQLSDLLKSSAGLWGINALLSLPLIDSGRREAGVLLAAARADEAAAQYREQVLQALKDVEDQLSGLALLRAQRQAQDDAVGAAERAMALSDARYRNGMVGQLELLDSRRTTLANKRLAVQLKAAQFQATVSLVKALGGGWSS